MRVFCRFLTLFPRYWTGKLQYKMSLCVTLCTSSLVLELYWKFLICCFSSKFVSKTPCESLLENCVTIYNKPDSMSYFVMES